MRCRARETAQVKKACTLRQRRAQEKKVCAENRNETRAAREARTGRQRRKKSARQRRTRAPIDAGCVAVKPTQTVCREEPAAVAREARRRGGAARRACAVWGGGVWGWGRVWGGSGGGGGGRGGGAGGGGKHHQWHCVRNNCLYHASTVMARRRVTARPQPSVAHTRINVNHRWRQAGKCHVQWYHPPTTYAEHDTTGNACYYLLSQQCSYSSLTAYRPGRSYWQARI